MRALAQRRDHPLHRRTAGRLLDQLEFVEQVADGRLDLPQVAPLDRDALRERLGGLDIPGAQRGREEGGPQPFIAAAALLRPPDASVTWRNADETVSKDPSFTTQLAALGDYEFIAEVMLPQFASPFRLVARTSVR